VLQKLIDDGVISPQETAAYVSGDGLTADGKTRISKLMLGRFFRDADQLDRTAPSIRNKLERIAAPAASVEGSLQWNLTPHLQGALDLLEEATAHRAKNLDDFVNQSGLFGTQKYSPESIALAKALRADTPNELTKAVRMYAQDARFAGEGSSLFGEPPTPADAFENAFGREAPGGLAAAAAKGKAARQEFIDKAKAAGQPAERQLEEGPHGTITREFAGKPREALAWVRQQNGGFAADAVAHPAIGSIGLPYGLPGDPGNGFEGGYGVSHIDAKHPGYLDENIDRLRHLPVVEKFQDKSGRITAVVLSDGQHRAGSLT